MANIIDISDDKKKELLLKRMSRIIQSANLNFIIGSGCSVPAIEVLGSIENDIKQAREKGDDVKADQLLHDFMIPFLENTNMLIADNISSLASVLENYKSFIQNISELLFNRKSSIIASQATVFSTNYDLLLEYAMNSFSEIFILCDGFKRTSNINKEYHFSSTEYFNRVYNTGNLYRYQVEIPSINLIKLHGSLNWKKKDEHIIQDLSYLEDANKIKTNKDIDAIRKFNSLFNIVFPQKDKFKITTLDQIYYDLLRIYSNEMDKENTILISEGFSFADEHIRELTCRALKNKTFNLVVSCFSKKDVEYLFGVFSAYRNVDIVSDGSDKFDFSKFNDLISELNVAEDSDE